MSANNEVLIERKQNGLYRIMDTDVDGAGGIMIEDDVDGLEEATNKANKYLEQCEDEGYPVEYGLRILN